MKRRVPARPPAPAGELLIRNRQRVRAVDLAALRHFTRAALAAQPALREFALGIHLVGADEMACVNETFLNHTGSTDIITFDHSNAERGMRSADGGSGNPKPETRNPERLHGELFICLDDAVAQARAFRTTWQAELGRYVIHGILHLRGYDDTTPAARRRMKREENRLLSALARRHPLSRLARPSRRP